MVARDNELGLHSIKEESKSNGTISILSINHPDEEEKTGFEEEKTSAKKNDEYSHQLAVLEKRIEILNSVILDQNDVNLNSTENLKVA